MRPTIFILLLSFLFSPAFASSPPDDKVRQAQIKDFTDQVFEISSVMLHDVINPPAASRFYAYSMLAAYQVVVAHDKNLPDLSSRFKEQPGFTTIPAPQSLDKAFAATYTMLELGKKILPSGYMLQEKQDAFLENYQKQYRIKNQASAENVSYAEAIAQQVLAYARTDGYGKLSTYMRYVPVQQEGHWYPTPPAYIEAIEPNWQYVRPFFMDSASQFAPPPPAPFSLDSGSSFHTQTMEVYETVKQLSEEQEEIANFWDCNPFAVKFTGHMAMGLKKITPGGHWMGIAGIACKKAEITFDKAVLVHTLLALSLHDAFISCWHEKYHSDRIRPETVINRHIDPRWKPLLQTPPFPEYSSGHSVASSTAAVILTSLLGDHFAYEDDSEVYFGLPVRSFTSFQQAADEAAISRLYGGIHFRDAIENGVAEGKALGNYIVNKLALRSGMSGQ